MVFDFDDFGANHIISDMCQSHDCRKELDALHYANPNFKATLFAIPGEMTPELLWWCEANKSWIELAVHGFFHASNYECEKMTYDQFAVQMEIHATTTLGFFTKGFKAPGWQISDGAYQWLKDNGWWVADQAYNNDRRPKELPAYVNNNGSFYAITEWSNPDNNIVSIPYGHPVEAWHGHVWNCMGNGIEETFDHVKGLVQNAQEFQFVGDLFK